MDFIKQAWDKQAHEFKTSHAASWKDLYAINLENEEIKKHIKPGDYVLDVGCANGYSTFKKLDSKPRKMIGVDFSEPMIDHAKKEKEISYPHENVEFEVGDIRNLRFADGEFDVVYTTRVLINLSNWEEQQTGLMECLRVLKPGGKLIILEAFWEPLVKLNALRTICELPSLVEHDFNRYLKKSKVENFLHVRNLAFENMEFSSIYYLGTRLLRDLIENLDDRDNYQNEINTLFYELQKRFHSKSGFGIQQAYVVQLRN